jgi:hypothetical protein
MNDYFKQLTNELSKELIKTSYLFLLKQLSDKEEDTSDLINLILSANLTCAFQLMKITSEGNNEIEIKVNSFIDSIIEFISKQPMITDIEFTDNK